MGEEQLYIQVSKAVLKRSENFLFFTISSMGLDWPKLWGVFMSKRFKRIITIIGDGSMLMNIQDLLSISHQKIPVIICVINNNGYLARHTRILFLKSRLYGKSSDWNLELNFKKQLVRLMLNISECQIQKLIDETIDKLLKLKNPFSAR